MLLEAEPSAPMTVTVGRDMVAAVVSMERRWYLRASVVAVRLPAPKPRKFAKCGSGSWVAGSSVAKILRQRLQPQSLHALGDIGPSLASHVNNI